MIVPDGAIDTRFLSAFKTMIERRVKNGDRFVVITGGGGTSRAYQRASEKITKLTRDDLDWLGIHATRLNAHLLRTIFRNTARPQICKDPTRAHLGKHHLLIAAGWKPGWSTDYVATRIAWRLKADMVVNLSNVDYVYDKDPRKHKDAKRIERISWGAFRAIVGDVWDPGMHVPFDPVASRLAHHAGLPVAIVSGHELANVERLLDGKSFEGTLIS